MAEPLAVALHAVRKLAPPAGEPVVVVGCGPIGGLAALLLSRLHDGPLLVSDRNAARASLVADVSGASAVDLEAGAIAGALGEGVLRYALDATRNIVVLQTVIDLIAGGGTLGLVGITHGTIGLDPNILVEREIALIGCHAFAEEMPEAVAMLPDLALALKRLIDSEIPLDEVPAAYQRLLAGKTTGLKTIIDVAGS